MNNACAGLFLLLGASALSGGVFAGGIDLALSDETANVAILLNPPERLPTTNGSELSVGGFVSEDDDRLAHLSLMARGKRQLDLSQYDLAAGIKAIGGDISIDPEQVIEGGEDVERVGAVGLGLEAGFLANPSRYNPINFSVSAFYAPSITSFFEAERFTEVSARLQIEVIPQVSTYIGYRRMGFDTSEYEDVRVDRSTHIGFSITY